ncbi:MAG: hypothetical protein GX620_15705 [Chloroflexi bacterium]|nr:hypothetical protein [Chloroflexota bacterium]
MKPTLSLTVNSESMNSDPAKIAKLEMDLNDFAPDVRANALRVLRAHAACGTVTARASVAAANLHCHTFFSFNAHGHSPSSVAWQGWRRGYLMMGIVDFDTLDGVDEFLAACEAVGLRGSAGIETRVFVPELASCEINSPGEPGVAYHLGIGFASGKIPEENRHLLLDMRQRAHQRNRALIDRVNAHLDPVKLDYEADVLPLTPGGNATERHIVLAYIQVAERIVPSTTAFWADRLGVARGEMAVLMENTSAFRGRIRDKLMKRGGIGYVQPGYETFPSVAEFHRLIVACGALPCAAWLDGASEAERAPDELLALHIGKGVVALNIIPDYARRRPQDLRRVVQLAEELDLPVHVGTEMNNPNQAMIDDFSAPEFAAVRDAFLAGAHFVYGHIVMQRALGSGYQSEWARAHLESRRERKEFFTAVGRRAIPGKQYLSALPRRLDQTMSPDDILARL